MNKSYYVYRIKDTNLFVSDATWDSGQVTLLDQSQLFAIEDLIYEPVDIYPDLSVLETLRCKIQDLLPLLKVELVLIKSVFAITVSEVRL
jgi:hypothetical protein